MIINVSIWLYPHEADTQTHYHERDDELQDWALITHAQLRNGEGASNYLAINASHPRN